MLFLSALSATLLFEARVTPVSKKQLLTILPQHLAPPSRHTQHSANGEPDPLPDNKKAVLYQLQLYILVLLNFDIDTVKYVLPLR